MPINSRRRLNSRAKGARGERELAHYLTDAGYPARRGQQFCGSADSPDVVCDSLKAIHIESKVTERLQLWDAISQAQRDASDKLPVVMHKRNGSEWLAILPLKAFLDTFGAYLKGLNETK